MPSLSAHQSAEFTKLLIMGDSGTGKTSALASLVAAGYALRILDFDNGLDSLAAQIRRRCPEKIEAVRFVTLRDKYKGSAAGPILDGPPTAFVQAMKLLDKWKLDNEDLGSPVGWGPETICVIDSFTFMGDAAFNWAKSMNPGAKEPRTWFYGAQQACENVLAQLTSESFRTNVIVISHIRYMDRPDGTKKGYPTAVGSALGPTIPAYFNSVAQCETDAAGKRTIRTASHAMIDLKNPASFSMAPVLPIENGLADFFKTVRGQK